MQKRAINPGTWQDQFDFSQAIELEGVRRTVLVSGQLSVDKDGNTLHAGDMVAQFHAALDNLEIVLDHASLKLSDLVQLNYFTTDIPAFLEAVPVVGERLRAAGCKPTSTLVQVVRLAQPDWMIELQAMAVE
jgi:enamine deaminase RidA (YjgF/YER057c/UK114 family)